MDLYDGLLPGNWITTGLLAVRAGSVYFTAPFFGTSTVPRTVRAGLALLTGAMLYPLVDAPGAADTTGTLLLWVGHEVAVGLLLGLLVSLFFYGVMTAGEVIGVQMGLGAAMALDPATDANLPVLGNLLNLTAVALWLTFLGPYFLLSGLIVSYEALPLGGAFPDIGMLNFALSAGGLVFDAALRIAAPVLVAMLLSSIGVALLARTAPRMQVYISSFPVTISFGLAILVFALPSFGQLVRRWTEGTEQLIFEALRMGIGG